MNIDRRVLFGFASAVIMKCGLALGTFVMIVMLARWQTVADYGKYAFSLNLGQFVGYLAAFGQQNVVFKLIPALRASGDDFRRVSILKYAFGSTIIMGTLATMIVISIGYLSPVFGYPKLEWSFYFGALIILPMALSELLQYFLRSYGFVYWALAPRDLLWRFMIVGVAYLVVMNRSSGLIKFEEAISIAGATFLALILVQTVAACRILREESGRIGKGDAESAIEFSEWWGLSLKMWIASASLIMSNSGGVVVAGLVLTSEETGAFFSIQRLSMLMLLPLIAINMIVAPKIAEFYAARKADELISLLRFVVIMMLPASISGWIFFEVWGDWLLSLFGHEFVQYHNILMVMITATAIHLLSGSVAYIMLLTGYERQFAALVFTMESLGLSLVFILGYFFGLKGSVVGSAVEMLGWVTAVIIWSRVNLGLDPSIFQLLTRKKSLLKRL